MILYLTNTIDNNKFRRKYIMTCLRNDKESILGDKKEILSKRLKEKFGQSV